MSGPSDAQAARLGETCRAFALGMLGGVASEDVHRYKRRRVMTTGDQTLNINPESITDLDQARDTIGILIEKLGVFEAERDDVRRDLDAAAKHIEDLQVELAELRKNRSKRVLVTPKISDLLSLDLAITMNNIREVEENDLYNSKFAEASRDLLQIYRTYILPDHKLPDNIDLSTFSAPQTTPSERPDVPPSNELCSPNVCNVLALGSRNRLYSVVYGILTEYNDKREHGDTGAGHVNLTALDVESLWSPPAALATMACLANWFQKTDTELLAVSTPIMDIGVDEDAVAVRGSVMQQRDFVEACQRLAPPRQSPIKRVILIINVGPSIDLVEIDRRHHRCVWFSHEKLRHSSIMKMLKAGQAVIYPRTEDEENPKEWIHEVYAAIPELMIAGTGPNVDHIVTCHLFHSLLLSSSTEYLPAYEVFDLRAAEDVGLWRRLLSELFHRYTLMLVDGIHSCSKLFEEVSQSGHGV